MSGGASGVISALGTPAQRQPVEHEEDPTQTLQRQPTEEEETGQPMQRLRNIPALGNTDAPLQRDALDSAKSDFRDLTGHDVSSVSVFSNSAQATNANALAFARGSEVHVAPGQFKPSTSDGRRLLGHEFAHVVQQRQGMVKPTGVLSSGMKVNDDPGLERAADHVGDQLAQHTPSQGVQRKCAACAEEERKTAQPMGNPVVQRVECNPTNRGDSRLQVHDMVVHSLANARGWDKEVHIKGYLGFGNYYADLATAGGGNVYEVKHHNLGGVGGGGIASARAEAAWYRDRFRARGCNAHANRGGWNGRHEIDLGDEGKVCIRGFGQGAITYVKDHTPAPHKPACNTVL